MTIRRIDQDALEHVGLPPEIAQFADTHGKRRLIVLLLEGEEGRELAAQHSNDQKGKQALLSKTAEVLEREIESRYFNMWDIENRWAIPDGDRVWIACDVQEWAMKARASRLLHEVDRSGRGRPRHFRKRRS